MLYLIDKLTHWPSLGSSHSWLPPDPGLSLLSHQAPHTWPPRTPSLSLGSLPTSAAPLTFLTRLTCSSPHSRLTPGPQRSHLTCRTLASPESLLSWGSL